MRTVSQFPVLHWPEHILQAYTTISSNVKRTKQHPQLQMSPTQNYRPYRHAQANIGRRRSTRLAALAHTPPRASGSRQMDNVFVQSVPKIAKRLVSENSDSSGNMKTAIPRARRDSVHGIASAGAQRSQIASSREDSVSSDGDDEDPLGDLERAAALKSSISTHKSASPPGNRPATDTRSKYNLLEAEHLQFLLRRVDRRRGIPTSLSPTAPSSTTAGTSSSSDVSATGVSVQRSNRTRLRLLAFEHKEGESQADRDFDDEEGKGAVGMPWRVLLSPAYSDDSPWKPRWRQ
ncbi:hypothetical protein KC368_g82 [Hortaea werneckii]|nr:hypothetical protein KC368_g82 [Hortaea werneckii]